MLQLSSLSWSFKVLVLVCAILTMTTSSRCHGWTSSSSRSISRRITSVSSSSPIRRHRSRSSNSNSNSHTWNDKKRLAAILKLSGGATTEVESVSSSTPSSSTSESSSSILSRTKSWIRRRRQPRTDEELKLGIAGFYDRSSKLWEDVWGEHMHHGYYVPANRTDHVQAQIDLIDQVLAWAHVIPNQTSSSSTTATSSPPMKLPRRIVDVGCGIGGSSRHMARLFQQLQPPSNSNTPPLSFSGITLSPYQAKRANELAEQQGLGSVCQFQVADAMNMPFDQNTFDLVWSLESGEHMPHKRQFCQELMRVCAPGGRILVVTWCHRDLLPGETELQPWEVRLLDRINRAYYLPKWCSVQDYVDTFASLGATDIQRDDWSYIIAPFWKAVLQSVWSWKSVVGLLQSGWTTQRGAIAMLLMLRGYQRGLIKFGCITCVKPEK